MKQKPMRLPGAAKRDVRSQFGAIPWRISNGKLQILLITSRGTGRWILPKGWPMDGKTGAEAARIEAWEEAGVKSKRVGRQPVGAFDYTKVHDDGLAEPCSATVYPIKVDKVKDEFPEAGQRKRKWVPMAKAAEMVEEPGLRELLLSF